MQIATHIKLFGGLVPFIHRPFFIPPSSPFGQGIHSFIHLFIPSPVGCVLVSHSMTV